MQTKRKYPRFRVDIMNITGRIVVSSIVGIEEIVSEHIVISTDARMNLNREYSLKIEDNGGSLSVSGVVESSSIGSSAVSPDGEAIPLYRAKIRFGAGSGRGHDDIDGFIRRLREESPAQLSGVGLRAGLAQESGAPVTESCRVKKISLGGMLMECANRQETERVLPVLLTLPDGTPLSVKARVASCIQVSGGDAELFDVGVAFADMPENDWQRLQAFVKLLEVMEGDSSDLWRHEKI